MADNNYTIPSEPLTREEEYLDAIVTNTASGGGGGKYVVDELTVTQNGTYTASGGVNAYNPVTVNVPNSYTAEDEGKVVNNGELVAQTSRTITGAGTYDTTTNNSVTVSEPEPVQEKDVNFYDYDGTVLYSYTAQEFLALTEMPANPTHEGLTAQGWNWTFQEAVDYVTYAGMLDVGQMYIPTDGTTKIYCSITSGTLNPYLGFALNGTATIDWGDNSAIETVTGTSTSTNIYTPHTYTSDGDYVISINVANGGSIVFTGDSTTSTSSVLRWSSIPNANDSGISSTITKIHFGNYITIGAYALTGCYNLKTITLPQESSAKTLGQKFINNTSIEFLIIPAPVKFESLAFLYNNILKHIVLHGKLNEISYRCFDSCSNLDRIILPYSMRTINVEAFSGVNNLKYIVAYCNVTGYGGSIYLGSSSRYCKKLVLSPTLTNISGTAKNIVLFSNLRITELDIPQLVTSISNAFMNCYSLTSIKFHPTTPPTLNTSVFTSLPTSCKIYVPTGTLTAYTTASNYPDPNTYTYIEY